MYGTIAHFTETWKYEYESTSKLFSLLNDELLTKKINPDVRSLQFLSWHITLTLGEMLGKAGLKINCPDEHTKAPSSIKEIIKAYETAAKSVLQEVEKNWSNQQLNDMVTMYGEEWSKGKILDILINHQTHHRGQMTIIMRMLGLKVISIYGPCKEEWALMNMPAMD